MNNKKTHRLYLALFSMLLIGSCIAHYKTASEKFPVAATNLSFQRGKNLVFNICWQCHYDSIAKKFTGIRMYDLPRFMGKIYSANLTASKIYGIIPLYSNPELAYLLKTGIARNGRYVPYMIRPNLADEDINDIIIYLRSGDAPVAAADTIPGKTHVNILGHIATHVAGKPLPYKTVKRPDEANMLGYGRYLVDNLACYHCHSKNILGLNYLEPEKSKGYMQGGMKFKTRYGNVYASNLTPDRESGIGNYTPEDFIIAVKQGKTPSGKKLYSPMPVFKYLTDEQVKSIYIYLQSLPPKQHPVKGK